MSVAVQYETARPGRKRRPPSGQKRNHHAPKDTGTPELVLKRAALVGKGEPALAATALGVMEARGFLTPEQHRAGVRYAGLRSRQFPPGSAPAAGLEVGRGRSLEADDPEGDRKTWERFEAAHEALRRAGAVVKSEVDGAAVHDRLPGWWWRLRSGNQRPGDEHRQAALKDGLDSLAVLFGIARKA